MADLSRLPVIGWREWVSLPDLGIPRIKAKIDTGARSCALHASDIEFSERDGVEVASFQVHYGTHRKPRSRRCEAVLLEHRRVTNSGGQEEHRAVIETRLVIGDVEQVVHVTLTERQGMKFRMLLGRTALNRRFLIDPGVSYLTGKVRIREG